VGGANFGEEVFLIAIAVRAPLDQLESATKVALQRRAEALFTAESLAAVFDTGRD
jgi:hypothetical protein